MVRKLLPSLCVALFALILFLLFGGNPLRESGSGGRFPFVGNRSSDATASTAGDVPPSKSPRSGKHSPLAVTSVLEPSPNFPHPAEHTVEELKDFHLPGLSLENTTLEQALTTLLQQYHDICATTNHTPLAFDISIGDHPGTTFSLELPSVSFLSALRTLAARAGMALDREGTQLSFRTLESAREEPANLITFMFAVPPTFAMDTLHVLGEPASLDSSPAEPLIHELTSLGLLRADEAVASYHANASQLRVTGSEADRERISAFLHELVYRDPVQTHTTTRIVLSDEPLDLNQDRALSPNEYEDLMRQLAQKQGVDISTAPSVVSKPGEEAIVEVIKELEGEGSWRGLKVATKSSGYGFGLSSETVIEARPHQGGPIHPGISTLAEGSATIKDVLPGNRTLISHSESPGGRYQYYFITVGLVDAAGRPVAGRRALKIGPDP